MELDRIKNEILNWRRQSTIHIVGSLPSIFSKKNFLTSFKYFLGDVGKTAKLAIYVPVVRRKYKLNCSNFLNHSLQKKLLFFILDTASARFILFKVRCFQLPLKSTFSFILTLPLVNDFKSSSRLNYFKVLNNSSLFYLAYKFSSHDILSMVRLLNVLR